MNVTPRYLGRGSWLSRRDPRLLVLVGILFVFTAIQAWDLRVVIPLVVIALVYYRSAGIPWHAVRRNWAFVLLFIGILVIFNALITGGDPPGFTADQLHVLATVPVLGTPISIESIVYAFTQFIRFIAIAAVGFPLAFAMAPADFGVTFARLGVPYKFAYGVDLTFRFVPSLAVDFRETVDAQRIRGYEMDGGGRNPIAGLRRTIPVIVPTVINAIAGAEDTIDAMDLRAFGTGRRTWIRKLAFDRTDWLVLGGFALLAIVVTIAGFVSTTSRLWIPPFLIGG